MDVNISEAYFTTHTEKYNGIFYFVMGWDSNVGFGEITLVTDSNGTRLYTESMDKEFVKQVFSKLIDDAELLE
jgi:hypothetical protein